MTTRTLSCAAALLLAAAPLSAFAQSADTEERPVAYELDHGKIDIAFDFLTDADVVGVDGEDVGDVEAVVRPVDGPAGLSIVFAVDNGWFEQDTDLVAPIGNFTIVDDDELRIDGVTELTVGNVPRYTPEDWVEIDEDAYETVEQAYRDNGWEW